MWTLGDTYAEIFNRDFGDSWAELHHDCRFTGGSRFMVLF